MQDRKQQHWSTSYDFFVLLSSFPNHILFIARNKQKQDDHESKGRFFFLTFTINKKDYLSFKEDIKSSVGLANIRRHFGAACARKINQLDTTVADTSDEIL